MTQTPVVGTPGTGFMDVTEDEFFNQVDNFIINEEKFEPKAYRVKIPNKDGTFSEGEPTVGFGFEFYGDEKTRVQDGDTMTIEEARPLLRQKTKMIHSEWSKRYEGYNNLTKEQQAGLISWAFNNGVNALEELNEQGTGYENKMMRAAVVNGDMDEIRRVLPMFRLGRRADGTYGVLNGLIKRRARELQLMNSTFPRVYNPFPEGSGKTPTNSSETTGP